VRYPDLETVSKKAFQATPSYRDFNLEDPNVSSAIFNIYRNQYAYDPGELNPIIENKDETSEDWVKEEISFNTAYGDERVITYLFLPKKGKPPFQTVIYFPGAEARRSIPNTQLHVTNIDFITKSGRAVMYPIYKGTYIRNEGLTLNDQSNYKSFEYRDYVIYWIKDFRRSIDYLETRSDVDKTKLAFYGLSWGGRIGTIISAVEGRLKTAIFYLGGFHCFNRPRPEVDEISYVSRVTIPVLLLNGRYDYRRPLELSVMPYYHYLGTPESDKRLRIYETGHTVPRNELIKETLDWLDRYLGPVK
jgi:predicted esterase